MMTSEPSPAELVSIWREERVDVETDDDTGTPAYHVTRRADEDVTTVVVMTVAAISEQRPMDLPTLASAVEPDALNQFVRQSPSPTAVVRFTYANHHVKIHASGDVAVRPDAD